MKISYQSLAAVAAVLGGMAITPVNAQNTLHGPADLVLTFQNPGGAAGATQTVTVALASTTFFRDAAPGSFTLLNTANIGGLGATLQAQFGIGSIGTGTPWYEIDTLHMGAIGFRGTSSTALTLFDFDPSQTLYYTKERETVNEVGFASSPTPTTIANSGTGITTAMGQVKGRIEGVAAGSSTAVFVEGTGSSFIDNTNPTSVTGVQSTAYGDIPFGVQGNFGLNSFGTYGAAGSVELALDLYRVQQRNDLNIAAGATATQYGFGEPVRSGEYLGTITINQAGEVGFLANIPEPSSAALLGLAAAGLLGARRRKA